MTRTVVVLVLTVSATVIGVSAPRVKGVDEVKTFDVVASRFKFEPAIISVVEGNRVRLRLRSVDRTHGIGIKAFRVKALIPKSAEAVTVSSWRTGQVRSTSLALNTVAPAIGR